MKNNFIEQENEILIKAETLLVSLLEKYSNSKRIEIDGEKFKIEDIDSIVSLKKKLTEKALSFFE